MHRIDTPGSVDGLFQDGNPATGQQATQLLAAWFNDVQENIAQLIEFAGIELEKGDYDQLKDAVIALIAGVVGDGSGAVPTTRQVLGGGLVTGGGSLAANLTLSVAKATPAEVAAGALDTKAVTPLGLSGLISQSGAAGAMVLNVGPVVIQVFNGMANGNGTTILTLPEAFDTECVGAWCSGGSLDADAQDNNPTVSGRGLGNISVFSARDGAVPVCVLAIGR